MDNRMTALRCQAAFQFEMKKGGTAWNTSFVRAFFYAYEDDK